MDESWEPNEEYLAYLKEIEMMGDPEEFERTYGFEHKCHCASDYEEGNVGLVSDCWGSITNDALDTCKRLLEEIESVRLLADELRAQVRSLGGEPIG